jgi:hypothetical protein
VAAFVVLGIGYRRGDYRASAFSAEMPPTALIAAAHGVA